MRRHTMRKMTIVIAIGLLTSVQPANATPLSTFGNVTATHQAFEQIKDKHKKQSNQVTPEQLEAIGINAPPAQGSYVGSCRNISQHVWEIQAECRATDGTWSKNKVTYKNCPNHSLTNMNGNLVCGP
jgi:hypothetical protein